MEPNSGHENRAQTGRLVEAAATLFHELLQSETDIALPFLGTENVTLLVITPPRMSP